MLKYENTAQVNDRIRAWDFEKIEGRRDRYVEGRVIRRHRADSEIPFDCYVIECDVDTSHPAEYTRVGDKVFAPFGSTFDFDGRIELIEAAA